MSQAKKLHHPAATIDDLLAIPEDRRWHEIIDGELVEKKAATPGHGRAQWSVARQLGDPFDRKPGGPSRPGGWWFAQDCAITFGPHQIYRPDVVGWRRERVPEMPDRFATDVVPDWICEILSTNRSNDLVRKYRVYHQSRVSHYWVLDPLDFSLTVYRWQEHGYFVAQRGERGEKIRPEPFDAVEFNVGAFFGDDDDEA